MKFLIALLLAIVAAGCDVLGDSYVEREAVFVAYNGSNDRVAVVVSGGEEQLIPANGAARFVVRILVPTRRLDNPTGPSAVDTPVEVSVAFRNLTTGRATTPIMCDAGAKITTTVRYEVHGNDFVITSCTSSYPRR